MIFGGSMDYNDIIIRLKQYYDEYAHGIKANANSIIESLCKDISALDQDDKDELLKKVLTDICDTEILSFLASRGNGNIPYSLQKMLTNWLIPRCENLQMPELRWFYQINKNNVPQMENAYRYLTNAFDSVYADEITYRLVFKKNLDALEFGMHELPIGLLISDDEYKSMVNQCDYIITKAKITQEEIVLLNTLKKQYNDYMQNIF